MKCLALALLFATALAAQRGGGGIRFGGFGAHHRSSFGGVGVRGHGWMSRGYQPGLNVRIGPSYHGRVYGTYGYGGAWGWGGGYPVTWPIAPVWASPAVYGAPYPYQAPHPYGAGYPSPYNPGPNVTIIMVPPATAIAPEQAHAQPRVNPPPVGRSAPTEEKPIERPLATESWGFLIAAKNGTVWLAREYTVANGLVRFTTTAGEQKEVPIADVDVPTTEQLNRERGVAVRLR